MSAKIRKKYLLLGKYQSRGNRTEQTRRYRQNNPIKNKAHRIVERSLKAGRLIKPRFCSMCEENKYIQAHHECYLKPLEIIWLCSSCHIKIHKEREVISHVKR